MALALTYPDMVRATSGRSPAKVALTVGDAQLTYRQLQDRIHRVAHAAIGIGLAPGDRAGVLAPNCPEFVELVIGLSAAGIIAVLLPPASTIDEVGFMIADSGARAVFAHPLAGAHHLAALRRTDGVQVVEIGPAYEAVLARAGTQRPAVTVREDDVFAILYTSGSTGAPKGVMLSHRQRVLSSIVVGMEQSCYSPDDSALVTTPLFHGAGLLNVMTPLISGGSVEVLPRFDIEVAMDLIERKRLTCAQLIPTHFAALFALEDGGGRRRDTSSLKAVVTGTAPMSQVMKERIAERFGPHVLYERYGSTEASVVTCMRPADQLRKHQSVGRPLPAVEVRLLGPDGNEVPVGELGEFFSRSPYSFTGYWGRPEATAEALRAGGWVTSGDIARRDEEGFYFVAGRKNDMIISGGQNIYPREVEEALARHPAVAEVAVLGMPDSYWGQRVVAFIAFRGAPAPADALRDFLRDKVARHKIPKDIHTLVALPRNKLGKVDRPTLQQTAASLPAKPDRPG